MAWLTDWGYRRSHAINPATGAGANYQIKVVVHYGSGTSSGEDVYCNSHCRTDFGDIRFTDDDETTELSYWMESKVDGDYAIFWVKVADSLESSAVTIYVYYGNATATYLDDYTDEEHGTNTFLFFNTFDGASLDTNKWTINSGTPVVSGGTVTISADDIQGKTFVSSNTRLKARTAMTVQGNAILDPCSGLNSSAPWQWAIFRWNTSYMLVGNTDGVTGTKLTTISDIDINYHLFEICWVSASIEYLLDGTSKATHTTYLPTVNLSFRLLSTSSLTTEVIDWVFISKYVSPEPAHGAWGSEEEPPAAAAGDYGLKTNLVLTL